jgi:sigma-B regulation protein RsbQ
LTGILSRLAVNRLGVAADQLAEILIFVHGFGCDQSMWQWVEPAFRSKFSTVLYDLTGCGRSDESAYDFSRYARLEAHSGDLCELIECVGGGKPVHLIGHSVGATIAVLAAKMAPSQVTSLSLVAPSPRYTNCEGYTGGMSEQQAEELLNFLELNHLGWSAAIAPAIMANADKPELSNTLRESFCRMDPSIAAHFARATFLSDHRADLKAIQTPSLIIQVQSDTIAPITVGDFIAKSLANAQLDLLACEGHCPHVSNPALVIASLNKFLSQ